MTRVLLLTLGLMACDGAQIPEPTRDPTGQTLVLPALPLETISVGAKFTPEQEDPRVLRLTGTSELQLGVGAGFLAEVGMDWTDKLWVYEQDCVVLAGDWQVQARSSDPSVAAISADGERLQLGAPGRTEIVLSGDYLPASQECEQLFAGHETIQVQYTWNVQVVAPSATYFGTPFGCEEAAERVLIAGAASRTGFHASPAASPDEPYFFRNAATHRQVGLTLVASPGVRMLAPPDETGLQGVQFEGEGQVQVTSDLGDTLDLRIVPPSDISSLELAYAVPWGKGREHRWVEDGSLVDWREVYHGNVVVPLVREIVVGDRAACSLPSPDWFELSASPGACASAIVEPPEDVLFGEWVSVGHHFEVAQDGECTLEVSAPALAGGQGLAYGVTAEFTESTP